MGAQCGAISVVGHAACRPYRLFGDKTLAAWKILKITGEVKNVGGMVTIASLATLSGGSPQIRIGVKRKRGIHQVPVDVDKVAGGKVNLPLPVSCVPVSLHPLD